MENNVNKPAESKSNRPSLLAVMYGTDKGNTGGLTSEQAISFDEEYFTAGTGFKQLTCNKDCTITIKALIGNLYGSWTCVVKNASKWYDTTYLIGKNGVKSVPYTDEVTVSLNAGDYIAGSYQLLTNNANSGGCWLIYLPIES